MNHREILSDKLKEKVTEHFDKVLEIGTGGGEFDKIISHNEYIKTDQDQVDVHEIPYPDNTFNCVFMSHAFEHFINPIKALLEIRRVLKVGGKVIIVTPFYCRHHVLESDADHLFVLTEYQTERLLKYTDFKNIDVFTQTKYKGENIEKEQDFNTFAIATK